MYLDFRTPSFNFIELSGHLAPTSTHTKLIIGASDIASVRPIAIRWPKIEVYTAPKEVFIGKSSSIIRVELLLHSRV